MIALLGFIFGSVLGSFIGLVHYRAFCLSESSSIIVPRSYCESCKKKLAWHELIPIFSFLILRGSCLNCKQPIKKEYFYIELILALTGALIFLAEVHLVEMVIISTIVAALALQIISDFKYLKLLDAATIYIFISAILLNSVFQTFQNLSNSFIGLVVGFLILFGINKIFYFFRKKNGIGGGDMYLFSALLCMLGIKAAPMLMFLAAGITILIGFIQDKLNSEMPFGTGLGIAGVLVLLVYI